MNEEINESKNNNKNKKEIEIMQIINNSETIINKNIYLFLIILFKNIFLKKSDDKDKKGNDNLDKTISKININLIKDEKKFISKSYNLQNITNILDFTKSQNLVYCGDIIENILIYIFSFGFKVGKDATFGQYLYNNIGKLRDPSNYDILNMINSNIFAHEELRNLKQLLLVDISFNELSNYIINEKQKNSVLYNLLIEIYKIKYQFLSKEKYNKKVLNYINKGYFNMKLYEKIYKALKDNSNTILDQDLTANSINSLVSNIFSSGEPEKVSRASIRIVRSFLISVFIYYQNKHSPLMNYPLKIEPRITNIELDRNNLRELGIYELGKLLIMNKNIKLVDYNTSLLRSNYLEYFSFGIGFHDNYTLEELNLSNNYLKEDSEESICKMITHLKGLKTLYLSSNELNKGLSSSFVVLRKLYRKGKTKLENLYLGKCALDGQALYELGELLKCKFCKLKKLFLSGNSFPYNNNNDFFKKLKKNKSLTEIYLNKNDIWNGNVDDILRIINITEIKYLYLYRIKITDFNKLLAIINRTKLIGNKDDENHINLDELFLTNLDLSNNDFSIKKQQHIELLIKLIEKTNLHCLDISHILYDDNPYKLKKIKDNVKYRTKVEELKKILEDNREKYIKNVSDLRKNKVDKKHNENLKDEKTLKKYDDEIYNIIENDKAIHQLFLRKEARKILNNEKNKEIRKNEEDFGKVEENLINYMIYKRAERNINKIEKEVKKKKLILI